MQQYKPPSRRICNCDCSENVFASSQYLNTRTDYVGNIMLTDNKLNRVNRSEGYAKYDRYGDGFCYNYYVKDHLGNVRLVANDYEIEQLNGYYPFGALTGDSFNYYDGEGNRFKYGGKEMQSEHRLNWYDFIARPYDPAKGSFLGIDPLCEKYYSISPYVYCLNNPLKYIDPTGMSPNHVEYKPETFSEDIEKMITIQRGYSYKTGGGGPPASYWMRGATSEQYQQTGKRIFRYSTPVEDIYGLYSGENFEGEKYNRGTAAAWTALSIIPFLKFRKLGKAVKVLVQIVENDRGAIRFVSKIGTESVEGIANASLKNGKLYLDGLHLGGSENAVRNIGVKNLFEMARDLGRQYGVTEVVIQGGQRTTGKYAGKVPTEITIKVK